MEVASKNSANLEQETKTTKIVTHPLFPPLASSFVEKSHRRDVHVKRSHSRCFRGHNLDTIICVRFHLYLFFPPTVRAITRNGYVVTSWEWQYGRQSLAHYTKCLPSSFWGLKVAFSHKALHTIQLNYEVLVECEKNGGWAAGEVSSSFEAKTSLCCAIFALVFTRQEVK